MFGLVFPIVGAAADFESAWDPDPTEVGAAAIPAQSAIEQATPMIPEQAVPANVVPMRPGILEQLPILQPVQIIEQRRARFAEWPIAVILTGIAVALVVTITDAFRTGAVVLGAVLCLAAVFRLVLPDADAGMLKSRSRGVDLAVMSLLAGAVLAVAAWIPPAA